MGKSKGRQTIEKKALKINHPNSRKAKQLSRQIAKELARKKSKANGMIKRNLFGEKLLWFKDHLEPDIICYTSEMVLSLFETYFKRFDSELEQIKLKHTIGQRKNRQHASREDAIRITIEKDLSDFETGGIEMVDILHPGELSKLRNWDGEMGYLNQVRMRTFSRSFLLNYKPPNTSFHLNAGKTRMEIEEEQNNELSDAKQATEEISQSQDISKEETKTPCENIVSK